MFIGSNTIVIKLRAYLQGTAEGPLGIGAFLIITFCVVALFARRK